MNTYKVGVRVEAAAFGYVEVQAENAKEAAKEAERLVEMGEPYEFLFEKSRCKPDVRARAEDAITVEEEE
jgi:hypothetical protein